MGVITLLFQKGDRLNPANWRPIIHHVVGRFIFENVALLCDLARYCEVPNFPAAILSLYTDDVSVIVSSDGALEEVFHTYARYERGTRSKLNLDKCEGLWLGAWRGGPNSHVPFQWTSNKIYVLGTFIGNGNLEEANWCPRVDAVAKYVSAWSSRNFSYDGRPLISNALALARVWALVKVNRIIFWFFWKGKKDLVARAVVIQSRSCGGFGIVAPHLKSQVLLLQWIKRF